MTKKIRDIKEILIVFIIAFIVLFGAVLTQNISSVDDMWTFNFAFKIFNGYIPYKDFNIVTTPLYAQVTALLFNIFPATMMTFKIIGVIECSLIVVFQYLISKKLNIGNKLFLVSMFFSFTIMQFLVNNTYNLLAILGIFILLYIEVSRSRYNKFVRLTKKEKNIQLFKKKYISLDVVYSIFTGIILGIIVLSKQNIGIYSIIGITLYNLLRWKFLNEISFKEVFKRLSISAIFCIIPIAIELIYLAMNGALYSFMDYAIFSVSHFGRKNYSSIMTYLLSNKALGFSIHSLIFFGIMNLFIITVIKKMNKFQIKNTIETNVVMLFALFAAISILFAYPLANKYHVDMTRYVSIFLVLSVLFSMKDVKKFLIKNIGVFGISIMLGTISLLSLWNVYIYRVDSNRVTNIQEYNEMCMFLNDEYNILRILDFKETYENVFNQKLYIISSDNNQYYIPLHENNNEFDLPLYGNLGKQDYNKIIDKLKSMENFSVMIIEKDEDLFWQDPREISKFIKENFSYVMQYGKYSIYMSNNLQ